MPVSTKFRSSGLASAARKSAAPAAPLWTGPCGAGSQGGITSSLLSRYFVCPERFRVHAVEGLRASEGFNHRLEYGQMWHVCEEELAAVERDITKAEAKTSEEWGRYVWEQPLKKYAHQLCAKYPLQQSEIVKWYNVCRAQFPIYVEWWSEHPDVRDRRPLLQEQVFDVPYHLPSGRIVRLRGKWDSVDLIGKGPNAGVWLQENKTKGDIDEPQLKKQLVSGFDLQTMLYLVALQWDANLLKLGQSHKIAGVRYNVIRRPLSGGRGSIVQKKGSKNVPAETETEFYSRLSDIIRSAHGPEYDLSADSHYFFMRWNVSVLPTDVERFCRQCLDPVLDNLCDDYEWWSYCVCKGLGSFDAGCQNRDIMFPRQRRRHFVTPFGVYNTLAEGGSTDLDEYIRTGSEVGLHRTDDLFPELKR